MAILVIGQDSPDAPRLRKQHLQEHFDYIETILDQISVAGPLKNHLLQQDFETALSQSNPNQGDIVDSSCFIYATDDLEVAKELFLNDPYAINGVYQSYTVSKFTPAAGEWIGGKIW